MEWDRTHTGASAEPMSEPTITSGKQQDKRRMVTQPEVQLIRPTEVESAYGTRDLLNVIFREKRLIVGVFLITFALGVATAVGQVPTYTAQARLLVLPSREYTLNPEVGEQMSSFWLGDERIVRSEMEILKNGQLVEDTIRELGIARLYPSLERGRSMLGLLLSPISAIGDRLKSLFSLSENVDEAERDPALVAEQKLLKMAALQFSRKLDISVVKESSVIELNYSHPRARVAVDALGQLIQGYMQFRSNVLMLPRSELFMDQRDGFAQRLDQAEREIATFKQKSNISEFTDQRSLLLRQLAAVKSESMDNATRLREAEINLETLRRQLASLPKEVPLYSDAMAVDSGGTVRTILASLEARRNDLATKFTPNSRFLADIDEQIVKLRQALKTTAPAQSDTRRLGPNPIYDEVKADLLRKESTAAALRAKQVVLDEQIGQLTQQLDHFNSVEKEFNSLLLKRELLEKNLRIYSQKAEESQLEEEIDRQKVANVRIIEQPHTGEPRSMRFPILVFALLGSGVLALLAGFLKNMFREVMISPEDVQRTLGLPVLLSIAHKADLERSSNR